APPLCYGTSRFQRTEQESNLSDADARLSRGPMTSASCRAPACPAVRTAGFEPALSGTPSRRIARLSHILSQSVQGESNPHVYPGQVARYRYVMDAKGTRASRRSHRDAGFEPAPPDEKSGAEPNQRV